MTLSTLAFLFLGAAAISVGWLAGRSLYVLSMIGMNHLRLKIKLYAAKVSVRRKADAAVAKARGAGA